MYKFKITVKLNCKAKDVFKGWLDNKIHSEFTGGAKAKINANEGGEFTAWDGYISGKNVEIFPHKKIIQTWRTTEFDKRDKDSIIEIAFTEKKDHTLVSLSHTNLPDGDGEKYKKGWKDYYFVNMKKYFEN